MIYFLYDNIQIRAQPIKVFVKIARHVFTDLVKILQTSISLTDADDLKLEEKFFTLINRIRCSARILSSPCIPCRHTSPMPQIFLKKGDFTWLAPKIFQLTLANLASKNSTYITHSALLIFDWVSVKTYLRYR